VINKLFLLYSGAERKANYILPSRTWNWPKVTFF